MPPDACAEARARSKKALQRAAIRSEPVLDEASFARQVWKNKPVLKLASQCCVSAYLSESEAAATRVRPYHKPALKWQVALGFRFGLDCWP